VRLDAVIQEWEEGGSEHAPIKYEQEDTDEEVIILGDTSPHNAHVSLTVNRIYPRCQNAYPGCLIVVLLANARMSGT
jgi:hypothetical protein